MQRKVSKTVQHTYAFRQIGDARHPAPVAVLPESEQTDAPFEEGAHDAIDPGLRHRMISEAAYYLYQQRGYADGYDMDDWLQAEAQVDHVALTPGIDESVEGATPQTDAA